MPKKFYSAPVQTVDAIKACAPVYGSQARALTIAADVLIRAKKPIRLKYTITKGGKITEVSYKLHPRTIRIIDKLARVYGGHGYALCAMATEAERGVKLGKKPA